MDFPIDLHIGTVVIPSHLIFEVLAFYVAFQYFNLLRSKNGDVMSVGHRWATLMGAMIGALIGSRILGALGSFNLFLNPPNALYYYLNQTIAGGIVGGIIGTEITKKIIHEKTSSGDLLTYPLILGIMIGRIGCFLTGVSDGTVGNPTNLPWAIYQGDNVLRHPTSLYEILFLEYSWFLLKELQKKYVLENGVLFRLFVLFYCSYRFFIEFIKPVEYIFYGFSAIQIICAITALYYGLWLLFYPKWTMNYLRTTLN